MEWKKGRGHVPPFSGNYLTNTAQIVTDFLCHKVTILAHGPLVYQIPQGTKTFSGKLISSWLASSLCW